MAAIASRHGVTLAALIEANRATVPNPNLIHVGQVLTIPGATAAGGGALTSFEDFERFFNPDGTKPPPAPKPNNSGWILLGVAAVIVALLATSD